MHKISTKPTGSRKKGTSHLAILQIEYFVYGVALIFIEYYRRKLLRGEIDLLMIEIAIYVLMLIIPNIIGHILLMSSTNWTKKHPNLIILIYILLFIISMLIFYKMNI